MKNLCFFNSCQVWGGGEHWHYHAACWCKQQGYSVLVITNVKSELAERVSSAGLTLRQIQVSNLSALHPCKVRRVMQLLRDFRIDVLFANLPSDVKIAGLAAYLAGSPQVFYRRGTALPVKNSWLNRLIFRYFLSGVIVNSQEVKRRLLQNTTALIPEKKIHVLYNGLDPKAYKQHHVIPLYAKRNAEIVLGNAGRFVGQKGHIYLVKLAQHLKTQGVQFILLLAGKGPLEGYIRRIVKEAGLEQEVRFVGFTEDINSFLHSIDIFVSTSLHEGSSHAVLEAMSAGKAIVAFDISSLPEMVLHEQNGLLVPAGDVNALAEAVVRLLHNAGLRERMGRNGQNFIDKYFTKDTMFRQLKHIIEYGKAETFSHNHHM
ncbi:group 1 glycosyl transferase [candidate division KSB3 bacterium]|uniref:Group 1 glycosyl transferase n=1 Tax=candidate division KSB3 bacterium TaxID=2044937 RepID=A0A2G6E694_9BACT|nr:MAG: group 1 glycosyl transferase [candidate division KSB3 bacterium]PIE29911.1 MAG: group 1 glycosyl transferase [candidate division KSB3 bacterium]